MEKVKKALIKGAVNFILLFIDGEQFQDLASSDVVWGKGFEAFWTKAYHDLDDGISHEVPREWKLSSEYFRYESLVELYCETPPPQYIEKNC
jgi:hypothetical protein